MTVTITQHLVEEWVFHIQDWSLIGQFMKKYKNITQIININVYLKFEAVAANVLWDEWLIVRCSQLLLQTHWVCGQRTCHNSHSKHWSGIATNFVNQHQTTPQMPNTDHGKATVIHAHEYVCLHSWQQLSICEGQKKNPKQFAIEEFKLTTWI